MKGENDEFITLWEMNSDGCQRQAFQIMSRNLIPLMAIGRNARKRSTR